MAIFQRRAIAPYKLYVGDSAGWQVPVEGASTTSWGGKVTVKTIDKDVQEDARQLIWHGKGEAQVYLQAASQDLTSYLESESALLVRVRVDSPPKKNVMMRVGCEWPCKAEANLTKVFKTLPGGVWTTLSMDLNCFAQNGADFRKIDTPFLLLTRGKFTLSIADIEIIPGVAREAALSCTK
ncbi:MAG: putative glycoside hydrolase [Gammaproteobacteria bacterium]|nr:putative glycoside hydrolase [Gammaproteobacteria bacterium]